MIVDLINQTVPFLATAGVEVEEAGGGAGRARVEPAPGLLNHIGTLHAAVLFGVAEAASGAAVVGLLGDRLLPQGDRPGVRAVVGDADIIYRRPAAGPVTAIATLELPEEDRTVDGLLARRTVSVGVALVDEDDRTVATAAFHWIITTG